MMIRRRLLATAVALGLSLPAMGILGTEGAAPTPASADASAMDVALSEYTISPDAMSVKAGQPVTFALANVGGNPHQLAIAGSGAEWTSDRLESGEATTFTVTFAQAGDYEMWCPVGSHRDRGMVGTIAVTP
jgi:plastocyanin